MTEKLGIVIATLNEAERIGKTIDAIRERYKNATLIIVDDCSSDGTAEVARKLGCYVPYHEKRLGYSKSLCEGLYLAWNKFNCDYIIEMDADHPADQIGNFLKMKNGGNSVIVGYEQDKWKISRKGACWLARHLLPLKGVKHPTCGFVLFSREVLSKIPWQHLKSKKDAIHIELLLWAWKKRARLYNAKFSGHVGERNYGFGRMVVWYISFLRLLKLRWLKRGKQERIDYGT